MSRFRLNCTLVGHDKDVRSVVSPSNGCIISALRDGTAREWRPAAGRWETDTVESFVAVESSDGSFMNAVTFILVNGEELIAAAGKDTMIYLKETRAGSGSGSGVEDIKYQLIGHANNICSLHHQGNFLISSSWDATARIWDLGTFETRYVLNGHQSSVWDAKIVDAAESLFLTCSADKTIRMWKGDHELWRAEGHTDVVRKLLILPGGKQFASCSNDTTIRIWDMDSGRQLSVLSGHESFVYDLNVLPTGELVSSGEDRTVRIWKDNLVTQAITLPCISLWCLDVLPNGDFVVGGSDSFLRIFTREESRTASTEELKGFADAVKQSNISEQSIDNLKKTDVPGYEALQRPGKQEGSTIMVANPQGTIEAHQWSGGEWIKIGDVVGSAGNSSGKHEFGGKEWDYLFDVDIEDGAPPLKLPYNSNENPYEAAERFLASNELPASYTDEVVRFIQKNTGGVELGQQAAEIYNPYSDNQSKKEQTSLSRKVLPQRVYINFKDYKVEPLVKGLVKFNGEQSPSVQFSQGEISTVEALLKNLDSKQALELATKYALTITESWSETGRLLGFDLLRISVSQLTTAHILQSPDLAERLLKVINNGLLLMNDANFALFMMILKLLNNLIDSTLFVQIYLTVDDNGKLHYNEYFDDLLARIDVVVKETAASHQGQASKHHSTSMTTLATLVYNLSVHHTKTSSLKSNPLSAKKIVVFINDIAATTINSSSEAAYRLIMGYGNFKYASVYQKDLPQFASQARLLYAVDGKESRFMDLFSDIDVL